MFSCKKATNKRSAVNEIDAFNFARVSPQTKLIRVQLRGKNLGSTIITLNVKSVVTLLTFRLTI